MCVLLCIWWGTAVVNVQFCCIGFPAGDVIHSLIGFENKGDQEFIITQIEGSLRSVCLSVSLFICPVSMCIVCACAVYVDGACIHLISVCCVYSVIMAYVSTLCRYPQDYSYHVQNVS